MKRLIRNGDVILDGTLSRREKEKEAFMKLEMLEELEQKLEQELGMDLKTFCEKEKEKK